MIKEELLKMAELICSNEASEEDKLNFLRAIGTQLMEISVLLKGGRVGDRQQ